MKLRFAFSAFALALFIGFAPSIATAETIVAGGGGGVFPADTAFNNVPISALEFGFGLEISDTGPALGTFYSVLLGAAVGGVQRQIVIEGVVSSGSRTAANVATISGTCTVNMGDGTPATPGVPFTATITTDANDQGTLGLVLGASNLPNAVVNEGTQTVK